MGANHAPITMAPQQMKGSVGVFHTNFHVGPATPQKMKSFAGVFHAKAH